MAKKSGVYKITNQLETDKFYIGSSKNIDKRWTKHRWSARNEKNQYQSYFYNAIRKHGIDNFKIEMVEECEPVLEILRTREQHYVDTLHPLYNIQTVIGMNGVDWTVDRKKEFSERRKEEVANGINVPPKVDWTGRTHSEESKQQMSDGMKEAYQRAVEERGDYLTPEGKQIKSEKLKNITPERRKQYVKETETRVVMARDAQQKIVDEFAKQYLPIIQQKQSLGLNLREIAIQLNNEGHKTRQGNEWKDQAIREVLKRFQKQPKAENSNNYRVIMEQKKQADDFAKKFIDIIQQKQSEGLSIKEIAVYLNEQGYKTRRNKDWVELAVRQVLKRFPKPKETVNKQPIVIAQKKRMIGWDRL